MVRIDEREITGSASSGNLSICLPNGGLEATACGAVAL